MVVLNDRCHVDAVFVRGECAIAPLRRLPGTFRVLRDDPHRDVAVASIASTGIKAGPNDAETVSLAVPPTPGRYFFRCDVHLTLMTGFLVVG